ncbi:TPA: hypothetical protein ACGK3A_005271, partial [Escherichia coli]|nr:hypothetical protein [Escherichia coli]
KYTKINNCNNKLFVVPDKLSVIKMLDNPRVTVFNDYSTFQEKQWKQILVIMSKTPETYSILCSHLFK